MLSSRGGGVVGGVGWCGLPIHFHVQPNCSVEVEVVLRCRWGCDNADARLLGKEDFKG